MTIRRRIEKLEQKTGVRREITLEDLLGAADADKECMRLREESGEEPSSLIDSILETAGIGKTLGSEHED